MEQIKKRYLSDNGLLVIILIAFGISLLSTMAESYFSHYLTFFWFKLRTPLDSTYDLIDFKSRSGFISILLILIFEKLNNSSDYLDFIKKLIGKKNEQIAGEVTTISAVLLSLITAIILVPLIIMIIIKWSSMSGPIDF